MPERILCGRGPLGWEDKFGQWTSSCEDTLMLKPLVEYVRADMHERELANLCAKVEAWEPVVRAAIEHARMHKRKPVADCDCLVCAVDVMPPEHKPNKD